ncbi:MAG TPA: hypothetical protein VGE79_09705 [Niastella sp.]
MKLLILFGIVFTCLIAHGQIKHVDECYILKIRGGVVDSALVLHEYTAALIPKQESFESDSLLLKAIQSDNFSFGLLERKYYILGFLPKINLAINKILEIYHCDSLIVNLFKDKHSYYRHAGITFDNEEVGASNYFHLYKVKGMAYLLDTVSAKRLLFSYLNQIEDTSSIVHSTESLTSKGLLKKEEKVAIVRNTLKSPYGFLLEFFGDIIKEYKYKTDSVIDNPYRFVSKQEVIKQKFNKCPYANE